MMDNEGARSTLDDVLPDYESIMKAPGLLELTRRAAQLGVDIEVVLEREREKRYKSVDSSNGALYLVANPASWIYTARGYCRPPPQFQGTISEVRRGGGGKMFARKNGSAREAF